MTTKDNAWVLVTGASSGFGEEFARQYAKQGRSIVLVARRLDRLQTLAEALRQQYHVDVVVEQVDLSDLAAVIQLHQRLSDRGIAIDILINNAGFGLQGPFAELRLGEALHRELKRDGITVTVLCPGVSDTGFANAAQQKITPVLKGIMMQPAPVVQAGIRAIPSHNWRTSNAIQLHCRKIDPTELRPHQQPSLG